MSTEVKGLEALDCETLAAIVNDGNEEWTKHQKQAAFDELARRSAELQ
jgi:hypothetical protein